MERFLLFSSDDHCGATASVYRQFMESRYLDDYDRWLGARKEAFEATVGGGAVAPAEPTEAATFGMNLDVRLARLEQEGIVGEVLFPGAAAGPRFDDFSIPFSGIFGEAESDDEFELHAAGLRAHNRWQAETSPDLDRQIGLAIIAFHDVDAAVAEIHRSADSGLRGVLLEGIHPTLPALDDPIYDPMWTACEERSMPVHFHAGIGSQSVHRITGLGSNGKPRNDAITGVEAQWLSHRPLWFLVMGGVCERHPKLRIVFAELGATWAPDAMNHFRWYWDLQRSTPHEPMYYYDRQVFFGSSMFTKQDVEARHYVGIEKLMWGGDHPHSNGAWGCTAAWLRATFGAGKVPEAEARAIFGENAVSFYGLDADKLRAIADRVGPTPEDVLRDPDPEDFEHDAIARGWLEFTH